MSSHLTPIRSFGAYSAAGVMLTAGVLLAVIPATFAIWPPNSSKVVANTASIQTAWALAIQSGFSSLCRFLTRYYAGVSVLAVMLMVLAAYGARWVSTSVRIETLFAPQSRILTDYAWLEHHVAPLAPIEVVVHCAADCPLSPLEQLELIWRVEQGLADSPSIGGTMSALAVLPPLPPRPELPTEVYRQQVEQLVVSLLPRFAEAQYVHESAGSRHWRVTIRTNALGNADYAAFLALVQDKVQPLLCDAENKPLPGISASATGVMPLVHAIQHALVNDLLASFLGALVVITLVMTLVQGGMLAGLVSMVSNVLPVVLLFGVLGWMQVPLDVGSVMTASVAMGIAVDDTLHFLTFFRRELDSGRSVSSAVDDAYHHCGPAMVQSSLICGLGLSVFALSDFIPTSRFAWMMMSLLGAALVGDLVVLPALLLGPLGRLFASPTATRREENLAETRIPVETMLPRNQPEYAAPRHRGRAEGK
jgi:predicted RND superfamily exporter protein